MQIGAECSISTHAHTSPGRFDPQRAAGYQGLSPGRLRTCILVTLVLTTAIAIVAHAQLPAIVTSFGPSDRQKSAHQRQQIDTLARRHLGTQLHGEGLGDLDILQRLLDQRVIERDDILGLQALGLVLGDVMAQNLPLSWVVIDDDFGHSRALRYRETPSLFFPVTMISKRVVNNEPVRMRTLFDDVRRQVEIFEARERPSRRHLVRPDRPTAETNLDSDPP